MAKKNESKDEYDGSEESSKLECSLCTEMGLEQMVEDKICVLGDGDKDRTLSCIDDFTEVFKDIVEGKDDREGANEKLFTLADEYGIDKSKLRDIFKEGE